MVRSKATSPHAYITMEVDYEGVERVRRANKDRFRAEHGSSLTFLPFIARALIDAIEDFPHVNASVGDGELIVHGDVHLGIAVDLDYEGLIVPVVHNSGDKRLQALARDIAELAERAHTKKLSRGRHHGWDGHDHECRKQRQHAPAADHQPAPGHDPLHGGGHPSPGCRQ